MAVLWQGLNTPPSGDTLARMELCKGLIPHRFCEDQTAGCTDDTRLLGCLRKIPGGGGKKRVRAGEASPQQRVPGDGGGARAGVGRGRGNLR